MEIRAVSKSVRISPRKVRLVADAIRNLSVTEAMYVLQSVEKKAATPLTKTLKSAVANAVNNANLDIQSLVVGTVMINAGQALKRFRPSTRGRIHPYKKRSSNITIVVKSVSTPTAAADGVAAPAAINPDSIGIKSGSVPVEKVKPAKGKEKKV
jgi:large subunit ribosomal protein L22